MSLRIVTQGEEVTAFLSGEIDHHTAKGMREEIDGCAVRQKPLKLVLDFREVSFMDSAGIGLVMGRYRLMQELGGELRVTGVPSHIKKVMRLSGLDKLAVMEESSPRKTTTPPPHRQPSEEVQEALKEEQPSDSMALSKE